MSKPPTTFLLWVCAGAFVLFSGSLLWQQDFTHDCGNGAAPMSNAVYGENGGGNTRGWPLDIYGKTNYTCLATDKTVLPTKMHLSYLNILLNFLLYVAISTIIVSVDMVAYKVQRARNK
ncbi:MAG: hypothetical protein WC498_01260 [Candidatus Saccharimonadales bacterium]